MAPSDRESSWRAHPCRYVAAVRAFIALTLIFALYPFLIVADRQTVSAGSPPNMQHPHTSRDLLQSGVNSELAAASTVNNSTSAADKAQPEEGVKKVMVGMATLVDTIEERYWLNRSRDANTCGNNDKWGSPARVLKSVTRPVTSSECRSSCERLVACNAWFWCSEPHGRQCFDWLSRQTVQGEACLLLNAEAEPQPLHKQEDMPEDFEFFSYHAGYINDQLFLRPPRVAIAAPIMTCKPQEGRSEEACRYSNWLNLLSLTNKRDHAHLRGYEFIVEAVKDGRSSFEVLKDRMETIANTTAIEWLLWMDVRAIILHHEMAFPFVKSYKGHPVALFADADELAKGNVYGYEPGVILLHNAQSARSWLQKVYAVRNDEAAFAKARGQFKSDYGWPYYTAMAAVLKENRGSTVYFENTFCLSCFWRELELEAPTAFAVYFSNTRVCNQFSLDKDEQGDDWAYNNRFIEIIKLSRCNHSKMLRLSTSRVLAEGLEKSAEQINMQAFVIFPGAFNIQASASKCRQQCQQTHGCNAWTFCWRRDGCDDGQSYRPDWYPYQSCELFSLPHNLPLSLTGRGPLFSSASHGFLPRLYHGSRSYPSRSLDKLKSPLNRSRKQPNVIIATAIPADGCAFPVADYINKLAVSNKQDWAHRHGFEVHISAEMIDPNVTAGNWNKLTMLRRVMNSTPRDVADWIMWMDSDTVLFNTSLLPRFDEYEGKNFVIWGQEEKLRQGDLEQGLNTGVMMFRNNDWSRAFLADVGQYAYMPPKELKEKMLPILQKEIFPLVSGFYDTPFFVWLLKTKSENFERIFFEDQISLNRHWLSFDYKTEDVPTLVIHYAGCTICNPPKNKLTDASTSACASEFFKAHAYARCTLGADLLGLPPCEYEDAPELRELKIRIGQ